MGACRSVARHYPAARGPYHKAGQGRIDRGTIPLPPERDGVVRSGYRRFVVPGLTTLLMLVVLLSLGTWQVYRLKWKENVLAEIATAEAAAPIPLSSTPKPYSKVSVTGRFLYSRAAQFGAEVRDTKLGPVMGSYQIVPLERENAPTILINRGWAPEKRQAALVEPSGLVTVTGYVRAAEPFRWFSPTDDVAERHFYTLNPAAIGAAVGIANPEPLTLIELGTATPEVYPMPAQQLPRPPNNHLSYVITWYGLAVALVVIFIVWIGKAPQS